MRTVGFILPLSETWIGGQNYIYNLVSAYKAASSDAIVVLGAFPSPPKFFENVLSDGVQYVHVPELSRLQSPVTISELIVKGRFQPLAKRCRELGLTRLLSPTLFLGRTPGLPVTTWIPDFQHRHLPQFFPWKTRRLRDQSFGLIARFSDQIVLSSEDAFASFSKLWQRHAHKVVIVPFTAQLSCLDRPAVTSFLDQHGVTRPFYYLPNQFWQHKNHNLAFDAIERAAEQGWNGQLICTGSAHDHRQPGFVADLERRMAALEERGLVRNLGQVPRSGVVALLQSTRALINPSLFEGRSTTVEEAIALGIPMLLSDLPVHMEQAAGRAHFFDRQDPGPLADLLLADPPLSKIDIRTEFHPDLPARHDLFKKRLKTALGGANGPCAG